MQSATHRHFVGVANPAEPTRRTILAHLAGAAFFLSSCMPSKQPKKSEEVPTWSSRAPKTSRICHFNARETLWRDIQPSRRHGGVGVVRPDYSKTITYELCARPDADPSKIFGCVIKADHDTDKLAFLMDDYAQYRFKNQIEEPFLEILQKTTDLRGCSAQFKNLPMSYRDWCFDDIDDYISNGFANRLSRIIARPRSATMPIK